jgi:serine/threonine protein kinase
MAAKKDFEPIPPSLEIGEEVSRGSYGVVKLATLDKKPVAVKQFHDALLSADSVHLRNFKKECEQLKHLNHHNIVKCIGTYQGEKSPILVMELMHETLNTYLERNKGKLSPDRVMEICSAVCEG